MISPDSSDQFSRTCCQFVQMEYRVVSSVKESLHKTIDQLSDAEVRHLLEFAQCLQKRNGDSPTLRRLADDPAFEVPSEGSVAFRAVEPIQGKGIAASRLLVEERQ